MAVGTLVSRGTGFLRTLVLTYAIGTTFLGNAYNNSEYAAEHRLLPDARRHLHRRGSAAAGPGGQARPGPRRSLYAADVHPGCAGPAGRHRAGHGAGGTAGHLDRTHHPRRGRQPQGRRAQPDGAVGVLLHPADLLLRHELADRGDPQHPRPVRRADVGAGRQQPRRDHHRRVLRGDLPPGPGTVEHPGQRRAAARDRHHPRRRRADRRAVPVVAGRRVPVAAHAGIPARRGERDRPDGRLDVGLRGDPVGRQPGRPDPRQRGLGRGERVLGVLHRVAVLPAPVRDRRHLGDHGAAAQDERARERTPVFAGP